MTSPTPLGEITDVGALWLPKGYRIERCLSVNHDATGCLNYTVVATRKDTNIRYLMRFLSASLLDGDSAFRFEDQLQTLSKVTASHFLPPVQWGIDDGFAWSAHEYLDGFQSVAEHANTRDGHNATDEAEDSVDDDGTLASDSFLDLRGPEKVIELGISLLATMEKIHESGCLQQDLRFSQILLDGDTPKIICPSPMLFVKSESRPQEWSTCFAEVASPELLGAIDHDIRISSEIYSVGILLYWLVAGKVPFSGDHVGEIILQHLTAEPDLALLDEAPVALVQVIEKMLRKEPRDRYQSAFAAAHDLEHVRAIVSGKQPATQFAVGRFDKRKTLTDPSFVGRRNEIREIESSISRAAKGDGQSVIVQCPSGMGKTRLIVESLRFANRSGFEIFRGQGIAQVAAKPSSPIMSIVRQLQTRPHLHEHLRDSLQTSRELIADTLPEFGLAIGLLRDRKTIGQRKVAATNAEPLADFGPSRTVVAYCKVLAAAASSKRPALFWLDDCQWFDPQTIEVLRQLLKSPPASSCFLMSMRNAEGATQSILSTIVPDALIEPKPLGDPDIRVLIESMAGTLPEEVIQVTTSLSSGSPFMASAIVRGMVETEALQFSEGHWKIDSAKLSNVKSCSNAADALLIRLENISASLLELLSVAAIVGKEFKASSVTKICKIPSDAARQSFNQARDQRLIWSTPDGTLTFAHDKIRETLIERLPEKKQKEIHWALAKLFSSSNTHTDNGPNKDGDIAYHYDAAGRSADGYDYALKAAEKALNSYSLDMGVQMLKIARRGVPKTDAATVHELESKIASTLTLDGKYEEAERWFDRASQTAQSPFERARVEEYRGELAFKRGMKQEAVVFLEGALESVGGSTPQSTLACWVSLARELVVQTAHTLMPSVFIATKKTEASPEQRMKWRIYSRLAHGYWYTREKELVLLTHIKGMNEAERYSPTPELGQLWSEHAPAVSLIPWASRGIRYAKKSLELRKQMNDIWGQGQSRDFYCLILYIASRYDESLIQARESESILLKTGDYWEVNIARYHIAANMYRKGQLKEAVEFCEQTYEAARKIGDFQSTGNVAELWARAARGDIPLAILEEEVARNLNDVQRLIALYGAHGVHAISQKKYLQAIQWINKAVDEAKASNFINAYTAHIYPWLATALRHQWESAPATEIDQRNESCTELLRAAKKAVWIARRFQNELPHSLRELGFAYLLTGRAGKARRAFEKSISVAQSQGALHEAALSRIAYGEYGASFHWPHHHEILSHGKAYFGGENDARASNRNRDSLSLVDRFDALLDAGQQISASVDEADIFQKTLKAAIQLLRGSSTMIIEIDEKQNSPEAAPLSQPDNRTSSWSVKWQQGNGHMPYQKDFVVAAIERGTGIYEDKTVSAEGRFRYSTLCSPITVGDKTVACLYVTNELVKGMYGANEIRIAEYLTSAAGAAIEKADSFQQLATFNRELEERVVERTRTIEARSRELTRTKEKLETARDDAQAADRTKSQFLARMSHEIRTPISAVIGFTDLMLRGIISDPIEQKRKLETIQGSGQHLLELVNDLLDLSKIEAGKLAVDRAKCQPIKIIHEVIDSLQSRAIENGNEIVLNFEAPIPKSIVSDRKRLKQIVTNVVGNAIKFTHDGTVTVNVRFAQDPNRTLVIEVADTGIGMTDEQQQKVFDPFVQADPSVTRQFGGTGLGLAISLQLVRSLGGDIGVSSQPGVGTTFSIDLPLSESAAAELLNSDEIQQLIAAPEASDWLQADLSGFTFFYADDAETNRDLIRLLLTNSGATVHTAEHGEQALTRLTDRHAVDYCPDVAVVLMDMQMPVMDGYTATGKLRDFGFDKPIIAFTANSMSGDREKCIDAGCSDFLSKPVDVNLLLEKVAKVCGVPVTRHSRNPQEIKLMIEPSNKAPVTLQSELDSLDPMMQTFARKFLTKLNGRLPEFQASIQQGNSTELHQLAHWAKGTAGTVGLEKLAKLAADIDDASKKDDWPEIKKGWKTLMDFIGQTDAS